MLTPALAGVTLRPVVIGRTLAGVLLAALLCGPARGGTPLPPQPSDVPWPTASWPQGSSDLADPAAFARAQERLFAPVGRGGLPDTRALLIVQGGRLVLERYAEGFGPESRFRSWSMAKSVTQALAGILVREGRLALDAPAPVPAWRADGDPRGALTLRHLLTMTSGLDNADGGEGPDSFVARLLFGDLSSDTAQSAEQVALVHEPGTFWAYSTGTSQIVAAIVAGQIGGGREGFRDFALRELATPLGAGSLLVEFDAAGTPLGGAFAFLSARDWARLGLLYLRDGMWDGTRILPAGWVDFSRGVTALPTNGVYGAHFWVNGEPAADQFRPLRAGLDAFEMSGNAGQFVVIVPDRDLVVVRLGEMQRFTWEQLGDALSELIGAFPQRAEAAR
jgi:CubicO group peptidase (beta-lactamase class C family)